MLGLLGLRRGGVRRQDRRHRRGLDRGRANCGQHPWLAGGGSTRPRVWGGRIFYDVEKAAEPGMKESSLRESAIRDSRGQKQRSVHAE